MGSMMIPSSTLCTAREKLQVAREVEEASKVEYWDKKYLNAGPGKVTDRLHVELAQLAIRRAVNTKLVLRCEIALVSEELQAGLLKASAAEERLQDLARLYYNAGADEWRGVVTRHIASRAWFDGQRSMHPALAHLYRGCDEGRTAASASGNSTTLSYWEPAWQMEKTYSAADWRAHTMAFYSGLSPDRKGFAWDHVLGKWMATERVHAAHIVPEPFSSCRRLELVFGCSMHLQMSPHDMQGNNALLLSDLVKTWFDDHRIVIVPVDTTEYPTRRWKTELLCPDNNAHDAFGPRESLHGKELVFQNHSRPDTAFLFLHFLTALTRVADLKRPGWQQAWERYGRHCPFPKAFYMREDLIEAIANHIPGSAAIHAVLKKWMIEYASQHHVLKIHPIYTSDETTEIARRIRFAVDHRAVQAQGGFVLASAFRAAVEVSKDARESLEEGGVSTEDSGVSSEERKESPGNGNESLEDGDQSWVEGDKRLDDGGEGWVDDIEGSEDEWVDCGSMNLGKL